MKAARIHAYGGPDALVYEDAPDPVAGAGEIVVEVEAVGVNPADYKFRNGSLAGHFPKPMPLILGMDVVGRVLALGDGVAGVVQGTRVIGMIPFTHKGGYAERVAAPALWFAPLPEGLSATLAASLPTPGTTGVELIEDDLAVQAGDSILVTGATGAVGRVACFAAQRRGAHVTAAVRARYRQEVRSAHEILITDDETELPFGRFNCIADTVGGTVANRLLRTLRPGGVLSSVSTVPVGDTGGLEVITRRFACRPDAVRLGALATALATGELELPPVRVMALHAAAEAHRLVEGGAAGKIVLVPDRLT